MTGSAKQSRHPQVTSAGLSLSLLAMARRPGVRRDDAEEIFSGPVFKQREDAHPHSRGALRPRLALTSALLKRRGRRESRVRAAPAVSCATCTEEKRTRAYRSSGGNPAFPAQWFTAYFELSPVTGLLPPSSLRSLLLAKLSASTGAPGPHDFAVRELSCVRLRKRRVHRIPPHVRDDRDPPLIG